jgi:hypothetical protein
LGGGVRRGVLCAEAGRRLLSTLRLRTAAEVVVAGRDGREDEEEEEEEEAVGGERRVRRGGEAVRGGGGGDRNRPREPELTAVDVAGRGGRCERGAERADREVC